jgi:hypothetical protein
LAPEPDDLIGQTIAAESLQRAPFVASGDVRFRMQPVDMHLEFVSTCAMSARTAARSGASHPSKTFDDIRFR